MQEIILAGGWPNWTAPLRSRLRRNGTIRHMIRNVLPLGLLIASLLAAQPAPDHRVKWLKIRVLSTMLTADEGIGEWGFSALVEVDGRRILFDAGARRDPLLNNAKDLD